MFILDKHSRNLQFPPVDFASPEGLLAIGGDLRCARLLAAYRQGIFPWYSEGQPILWWSPDPRATLFPHKLKVSRSLKKTLRKNRFRITLDVCFPEVIRACAAPREQQPEPGTWILPEMVDAYSRLHELGYAHSIEAWLGNELAGGLYGVALGGAFFGESMFSRVTDASKVAFVYLVHQLQEWEFQLIDCQVSSPHLTSLGAEDIRREHFMKILGEALRREDKKGPWHFNDHLAALPSAP